ncbi:MAG TPA: hypothetical protein VJ866_18730, partial [Pyrinomonadaceae bacterium]|nr:hypothetical protein [Pyrinomonadaceae bacterium]
IPLPEGVDARVGPVRGLAGRFLDWIETGVPTTPSFREGLRVQALLDAALQSDAAGEPVSIPPAEDHAGASSGDFS